MAERVRHVVVTGGAGFIGSHLVDRLLATSTDQVIAFDNFSRGRLENIGHLRHEPRFELIEGDVRDYAALAEVVRRADLVYHLAAQSSAAGATRDVKYTVETNVMGTCNVLRAAAEEDVARVVFASSREVYGEPLGLPVNEESPLLAINVYGATKIAGEALCRAFRRERGLQTVVLRLANVYGPRDEGRVVPVWLENATIGRDLQVFGGKQVIDFVWIGQVAESLLRAGYVDGPMPAINIGSGTGTRIVDLARRIARMADSRPHIRFEPARPIDVTRFVASVDRMRQILSVEPPLDPLGDLASMFGAASARALT
jgi:UDP-glucose 4-epimerase